MDSTQNGFPTLSYDLMWYTHSQAGNQDQIPPAFLYSNIPQYTILSENPINPTIKIHFTEPVGFNINTDIRLLGEDGHTISIPTTDSNQISTDIYGMVKIQIQDTLLHPATKYNLTLVENLFRDLQSPDFFLTTKEFVLHFTSGVLKTAFGLQYYGERKFLLESLFLSQDSKYFVPAIQSFDGSDILSLESFANLTGNSMTNETQLLYESGELNRNLVLSNAYVRGEEHKLVGVMLRNHIYGLKIEQGNFNGECGNCLVNGMSKVPEITTMSYFRIKPLNKPALVVVEGGGGIRKVYTDTVINLTDIYILDDGVADLMLTLRVQKGVLTILETAWARDGKLNVLNAVRFTRDSVSLEGFQYFEYKLVGNLNQLNAALTHMTYFVESSDSFLANPVQDVALTIEVVDGERYYSKNTVLFIINDNKPGPILITVQNVTNENANEVSETTRAKNKVVETGGFVGLHTVCDFSVDNGGDSFARDLLYAVEISSDSCSEFILRDPVREQNVLSSFPVLEGSGAGTTFAKRTTYAQSLKLETGFTSEKKSPNLSFTVASLPSLNKILKDEVLIKPCRCFKPLCEQSVVLSVRNLVRNVRNVLDENVQNSLYVSSCCARLFSLR